MATLVDTLQDEEQILELARFVNKILTKGKEEDNTYVNQCEELLKSQKQLETLQKILEQTQHVFNEGSEKDTESFFFVLLSQIRKLHGNAFLQLKPKLLAVITMNKEDKVLLRVKILNNIHNVLLDHADNTTTDRFDTFMTIVRYLDATRHTELLLQYFKNIDKRVKDWGLSKTQMRELYKSVRDVYKATNNNENTLEWSIKYLATFEGGPDDPTAIEESINSIIQAIKSPEVYRYDALMELSTVKKLESANNNNKTTNGRTVQLLKIFASEILDAFTAFAAENPDYFKTVGIDQEECVRKMRVLSLTTLGSANHEIAYSVVAKTLQIDENDVEAWVIMAISENVMDAKMDQLKRVILVNHCLQRVFTRAQWKVLSTKIDTWRNNISILLKTLQNCQRS